MANADEYKSKVGLDSLYVASVTADSSSAYTAGTPAWLAPAAEAGMEPSTSFEIQFADDQPFDVMTAEADTKINLKIPNIDPQTLALITGRQYDTTTGRMYDNGGTAPYMALSFRSKKSNGKYRYYQFLKGKFDMPKEEAATLGEKPEPKMLELTYTAIRTVYKFSLPNSVTDSVKRVIGDEDSTNFSATNFFAQVQVPSVASVTALSLGSSVPAASATGIVISANLTLTFNNALQDDAIYNVVLINNVTSAVIAGAITLDAAKKIITIDPTASLAAATVHRVTYAVNDVYNQHVSGSFTFTTA